MAGGTAYLGEVRPIGYDFAPKGWALCDGQIVDIVNEREQIDNSALFSLLGTTYGGDGRTTFGLPDLRGRVPLGTGHVPGLPYVGWGHRGGNEKTVLVADNIPALSGTINVTTESGNVDTPTDALLAQEAVGATAVYNNTATANATMKEGSITVDGESEPFGIREPYVGMNWMICMDGLYPNRP
ncbi:MAG: tail fiber protein [Chloroflexota bacterium]